jgi:hypothetical protein
MSHYNEKELMLIKQYSHEITYDLSRLLRAIDEFDSEARFKIMNGRMTDIFDNYRRLHAIVFKYKEISNENLIKMKFKNIKESYEDFLEYEREISLKAHDTKQKIISNMESLTLVQNLQNLINLNLIGKKGREEINTFNQEIIDNFLCDINTVNECYQKLLNLGYIRRQYHKA